MTIKEAAERYDITVQAIYSRLKKNGIRLEKLKNPDTGDLTEDAEAIFERLFNKDGRAKRESFKLTSERLQADVYRLESENSALVEKLKQLEAENTALRAEKERLFKLAEQAQELQRATLERLLPPPADNTETEGQRGSEKRGLFARMFGRK